MYVPCATIIISDRSQERAERASSTAVGIEQRLLIEATQNRRRHPHGVEESIRHVCRGQIVASLRHCHRRTFATYWPLVQIIRFCKRFFFAI